MGDTRQRIIDATTELFRQRGFNGTSLKMITHASGATTGSLYHFFPAGKDQLAATVVEQSGAAYLQLFELFADSDDDLAAAMAVFFEGGAQLLEETDFIDPCPIGTIAREVASVNATLREATQQVFRSWITAAAVRFERAGLPPTDAAELATTIVAVIEGAFVLARAARDAAPFRACGRQVHLVLATRFAAADATRQASNT